MSRKFRLLLLLVSCSFVSIVLVGPENVLDRILRFQKIEMLPSCDNITKSLVGVTPVDVQKLLNVSDEIMVKLKPGGYYEPEACVYNNKTAIIIPYRDRMLHLKHFLNHYHPLLQRQNIVYRIFVIAQMDDRKFNRGMLLNIGFVEAQKYADWGCYVFHDVDHLLENDHLIYECNSDPTLFSTAIQKFGFRIPYNNFFGGVTAITREQMLSVNGYPNAYWGWGGEDDDMSRRLRSGGYDIINTPTALGRYVTDNHPQAKQSSNADQLLSEWYGRWENDGINSLKYRVLNISENLLYTLIEVSLEAEVIVEKSKQVTEITEQGSQNDSKSTG